MYPLGQEKNNFGGKKYHDTLAQCHRGNRALSVRETTHCFLRGNAHYCFMHGHSMSTPSQGADGMLVYQCDIDEENDQTIEMFGLFTLWLPIWFWETCEIDQKGGQGGLRAHHVSWTVLHPLPITKLQGGYQSSDYNVRLSTSTLLFLLKGRIWEFVACWPTGFQPSPLGHQGGELDPSGSTTHQSQDLNSVEILNHVESVY